MNATKKTSEGDNVVNEAIIVVDHHRGGSGMKRIISSGSAVLQRRGMVLVIV